MNNYKKKKEPNKHIGFWIDPEIDREIDRGKELAGIESRSAFVEKAIKHYVSFLQGEKTDAEKIMAEVKNFEKHMASILFKIAGEQATIELLLADRLVNLSDEMARWYRNSGYNIVRKRNGFISFSDANESVDKLDRDRSLYEKYGGDNRYDDE